MDRAKVLFVLCCFNGLDNSLQFQWGGVLMLQHKTVIIISSGFHTVGGSPFLF